MVHESDRTTARSINRLYPKQHWRTANQPKSTPPGTSTQTRSYTAQGRNCYAAHSQYTRYVISGNHTESAATYGAINTHLAENGDEQGRMEDRRNRPDVAELVERLRPADGDDGHRHEHSQSDHLSVAVLDSVQVQDRQRIGGDEAVQGQDLVCARVRV